MVATEELRILLRTIADTTGAKQTEQALSNLKTQGTQSLTAIGIAAGVGAKGVDLLAAHAGDLASALGDSIQVSREHERVIRATAMSYGAAASQYQQFAQQLSATTGFTSDAILEAALSARTLSQNYGLTIQQTQKLISVSADLARVRGIGIAQAFERVQSAIRGEAEASEYLGLTLNDTYLTNQAMNGSLKSTFGTMTDLEKAQVRYNELLKQSAQFSGLAAQSADSLDGAFGRAENSGRKLQTVIGDLTKPEAIKGLDALAKAADLLADGLKRGAAAQKDLPPGVKVGDIASAALSLIPGVGGIIALGKVVGAARDALNGSQSTMPSLEDRQAAFKEIQAQYQEFQQGDAKALDAGLKRIAVQDQLQAATLDLIGLQKQGEALQRQSTQLSAEEARIKLSLLPAQQQMAAAQRDMTEQQLRARQAALPATEALEDLRYEQERARLIAGNRQSSTQDRLAARRQLRDLARAAPGVELAALNAERGLVPSSRAATRLGIEGQLLEIRGQRALAGVGGALAENQLQQVISGAMIDAQRQVLSELATQLTKNMTVTVNITHEDGRVDTYTELIEANTQAQLPPVVPQSGVRRAG